MAHCRIPLRPARRGTPAYCLCNYLAQYEIWGRFLCITYASRLYGNYPIKEERVLCIISLQAAIMNMDD